MQNAIPFRIPNIAGSQFVIGPSQVFNPGEPNSTWKQSDLGMADDPKPWPHFVGVINLLIGNPGMPRSRGQIPVVDRFAPNPENYLFLGGVVSKSKG